MTLRRASLMLCLLLSAFALILSPAPAHAAGLSVDSCAQNYGMTPTQDDYTSKVIICVQFSILNAVGAILGGLSVYMTYTVTAMIVLAVVVLGMRILAGEPHLKPIAVGLAIRLGVCWIFSYNLNGLGGWVFGFADDLNNMITGGYTPWMQLDGILGQLFGFGTDPSSGGWLNVSQGLLGLVSAALFSSSLGAIVFLAGIMAFLNLIMFIFQVAFLYLMSFMLIGFMIILSALVVPLGIFFYTERYVKKWLDITIAGILTPVLLLAFLYMFLGIFTVLIQNFFNILGGNDFRAYWKINQPAFSWLMPGDPQTNNDLQNVFNSTNTRGLIRNIPPVQTTINSQMHVGFNAGVINKPGIDFGPNNVNIMQQLIFSFVTLWIFAMVMKEMVQKIPDVASSIASTASHLALEPMSAAKVMQDAKHNIATGAGVVAGGRTAGALAGEGSSRMKEAGAIVGGFMGSMIGKRL